MKKLLTNKKLMSCLSLVLVLAMVITNLHLGGVKAKADSVSPNSSVDPRTKTASDSAVTLTKSVRKLEGDEVEITFNAKGGSDKEDVGHDVFTDTSILFVLDYSISMSGSDKSNYKNAIKEFSKKFENGGKVSIGVICYSESAKEVIALTNNMDSLRTKVDNITNDVMGREWKTNTQEGIRKAESILSGKNTNKIVVLMSDGEPTMSYRATDYIDEKTLLNTGVEINLINQFNYSDEVSYVYNGAAYYELYKKSYDVVKTKAGWYLNGVWQDVNGVSYDGTLTDGTIGHKDDFSNYSYVIGKKNSGADYTEYKISTKTHWFSSDEYYFTGKDGNRHYVNKDVTYERNNIRYIKVKETYAVREYIYSKGNSIHVENNGYPTISEKYLAEAMGLVFYTVAYGKYAYGDDVKYVLNNIASSEDKAVSSSDNAKDLEKILATISDKIYDDINAAQKCVIIDNLPAYMTAESYTLDGGQAVTVTENKKKVEVNIGDLNFDDEDGTTLKIRCKVDKEALNNSTTFTKSGNVWIDMNASAQIKYNFKGKTDDIRTLSVAAPQEEFEVVSYSISYTEDGKAIANTGSTGFALKGTKIQVPPLEAYTTGQGTIYKKDSETIKNGNETVKLGYDRKYTLGNNAENVLVVNYELKKYTVEFFKNYDVNNKDADSNRFSREEVTYNATLVSPAAVVINAYADTLDPAGSNYSQKFLYWVNENGEYENIPEKVTENIKVYGKYGDDTGKPKTYNVTFYKEDKTTVVTTKAIAYNSVIIAPDAPNKDETAIYTYAFAGWKNVNGDAALTTDTTVTGNMDFYATYEPTAKTYEVHYIDIDGKTQLGETRYVSAGSIYSLDSNVTPSTYYIKDDNAHVFSGTWNVFKGSIDGEKVQDINSYKVDGNLWIVAQKDIKDANYTVTWHWYYDGSNWTTATTSAVYGGSANAPSGIKPAKVDTTNRYTYNFDGRWYTSDAANATEAKLTDITSNLDVYAGFTSDENTFTVTFKYKDSEGAEKSIEKERVAWDTPLSTIAPTVDEDSELNYAEITSDGAIKQERTFKNWNYVEGTTVRDDLTVWAADDYAYEYKITFTGDGITTKTDWVPAGEIPDAPTVNEGVLAAVQALEANKYNDVKGFNGWKSGDDVYASSEIPEAKASVEYVADYDIAPSEYTISYQVFLDGKEYGKVESLPNKLVHGASIDVSLISYNPIIDDVNDGSSNGHTKYEFVSMTAIGVNGNYTDGFTVEKDGLIKVNYTRIRKDAIVKFYKVDSYKDVEDVAVFTNASGSAAELIFEGYAGDEVTAPVIPEPNFGADANKKYTFKVDGWYVDGVKQDTKVTAVADTTTIVNAKYTATLNKYTITFADSKEYNENGNNINHTVVNEFTLTDQIYGHTFSLASLTAETDATGRYTYGTPTWMLKVGEAYAEASTTVTGDMEFYSSRTRTENPFKIIFHDSEVEASSAEVVTNVAITNTSITAISGFFGETLKNVPTPADKTNDERFDFEFDHWAKMDGTPVNFTAGADDVYKVSGNDELYAVYKVKGAEKPFTVLFMSENNTYFDGMERPYTTEVLYGNAVAAETLDAVVELASKTAIAKSNEDKINIYEFAGWKMKDENGTLVNADNFLANVDKNKQTVYASYKVKGAHEYNFVYLNDKIENAEKEYTKSEIKEFIFAEVSTPAGAHEPTPAAVLAYGPVKESKTENFTFIGWKLFTGTVVDDPIQVVVDRPEEEVATEAAVRVLRSVSPISFAENTAADEPTETPVILKNEFVFDKDLTDIVRGLSFVAGDVYLVPVYEASTRYYTVTFVDYDGKELKVDKVEYEQAATAPVDPTRSGFTFAGWDKDFSKVVENMTVTAKYNQNGGGGYYYPPTPNPDPTNDNPPAENPPAEQPEMTIDPDDQALGEAVIPGEEPEDMEVLDDEQALGDALVKTGTVPVTVFYGFGATLMLAALFLAFRKKREEA